MEDNTVVLSRENIRQINYFIIRSMWQIIKGRAATGTNDTIFNALDIKRLRYSRITDTGKARMTTDELAHLVQATGVSVAIFEGKEQFNINGITAEEWLAFCKYRAADTDDKKETAKNISL